MTDQTFSLTGTLPEGTTLLEASAGTGKTYTIAGLVLRYVAEAGVPLARILVVTFTRAATAELRDRVRRRLVEATEHLRAVLDGAAPDDTDDDVLALLATADEDVVATRLARVEGALGDFDAATVATIHGFCQQVLAGLGVAADVPRGAELVTETDDLVDEVVGDLLVARYADRPGGVPFSSPHKALTVSRKVLANPSATLVPTDHPDEDVRERVAYAAALRSEAAARKSAAGVLAFDDLLTRLADSLDDPVRGPAARAALRRRYQVALVDEFQDTDPVQWRIVHGAFHDRPDERAAAGDTTRALVLIGDPKQAIYAFRGADIHAYLSAVEVADTRTTLGTNYRSDGPLLEALDVVYRGARFGDPRIAFASVRPAPGAEEARIVDPAGDPPLVVRRVPLSGPLPRERGGKKLKVGAVREHIARDVAAEVVRMLDPVAPIELVLRDGARRRLRTSDVAVLVRTNAEARLVQTALLDAEVPAIVNGVGSVFSSDAAVHWRTLLLALERPSDPGRARAAAVGPLLGWTADRVADADDDALDRLHMDLHRWAGVLGEHGVAALLSHLEVATRVHARLLRDPDGQRVVTDLEHLGELLHTAATAEHLGVAALRAWLDERIAEADEEVVAPEERARRLESDAEAVQILTVHRSKGLEFPVVLAPYLWNCNLRSDGVPSHHDDALGRVLDVSDRGRDQDFQAAIEREKTERRNEEMRLLYVATTRAAHRLVLWWAPAGQTRDSALTTLLVCRGEDGVVKGAGKGATGAPTDEACERLLERLVTHATGRIGWHVVPDDPTPGPYVPEVVDPEDLDVARFDRDVDRAWSRTSYSRLTAPADAERATGVAPVEPETAHTDDEPGEADGVGGPGVVVDAPSAPDDDADPELLAARSPLADLPGGTEFGTLVHTVLEHVDPHAPDLEQVVADEVERRLRRARMEVDPVALTDGLVAALRTPLGPVLGGRALVDVPRADLLPELEFELPLVGATGDGDGRARLADVADLLDAHLPTGDPLAHYADVLRGAGFTRVLRGYLTGSIDLVVRVVDDGVPRYVVVDHKTNRLGVAPRSAADFTPAALADAMVHGHYPLQALLYAAATHRLLRWRQPGYDPAVHLGGVAYLFLRGMTGPDVPHVHGQPCGVFGWRPPASLVVALSELLDSGRTDGRASA